MRYVMTYWFKKCREFLRYNSGCTALASHAFSALARLSGRESLRRLTLLLRAARLCSSPTRLGKLESDIRDSLACVNMESTGENPSFARPNPPVEVPKAIILKPPVSEAEKGVLYVTFEDQWVKLLRSGQARSLSRRYDLILGPSWSPPHDLSLLLAAKLWPGQVYSLLSNLDDASSMRGMSDKIIPIPLLASSWVDPDVYRPYLGSSKEHDIVMLALFGSYKRHWLLFHAMRKLPRHFRVVLLGVPYGDRTEKVLMDEATRAGVSNRIDLRVRPTRPEIVEALCKARTSLIFSRQEGSCIAVVESLLADTPVGLFRHARIGSKAFVNEKTGMLLEERGLARQLQQFVESSDRYEPRRWALDHLSCHVSHGVLNRQLRSCAERAGKPWTKDILPMYQNALPCYVNSNDQEETRPCYEDLEREYGVRLGRPIAAVAKTSEPSRPLAATA